MVQSQSQSQSHPLPLLWEVGLVADTDVVVTVVVVLVVVFEVLPEDGMDFDVEDVVGTVFFVIRVVVVSVVVFFDEDDDVGCVMVGFVSVGLVTLSDEVVGFVTFSDVVVSVVFFDSTVVVVSVVNAGVKEVSVVSVQIVCGTDVPVTGGTDGTVVVRVVVVDLRRVVVCFFGVVEREFVFPDFPLVVLRVVAISPEAFFFVVTEAEPKDVSASSSAAVVFSDTVILLSVVVSVRLVYSPEKSLLVVTSLTEDMSVMYPP